MIVVQPHFDDAVFSAGATLAHMASQVSDLLTICSAAPEPELQSHYDVNCGFSSSTEAMTARVGENVRASLVLGLPAQQRYGGLLDQQYGGGSDEAEIQGRIEQLVAPGGHLLAPLGIVHADHLAASRAAVRVFKHHLLVGLRLWLYEDLPYRVLHPEFTAERLEGLREDGLNADLLPVVYDAEDQAWKAAAVCCYRSQLDVAPPPEVMVPERIWEVTAA